jgi:hypothetical protein
LFCETLSATTVAPAEPPELLVVVPLEGGDDVELVPLEDEHSATLNAIPMARAIPPKMRRFMPPSECERRTNCVGASWFKSCLKSFDTEVLYD